MTKREIRFRAWEGRYEVGNDGSVWSLDYNHTGKRQQLHTYLDQDGYPYVFLVINGKRFKRYPHRMVATLFLERPSEKHQVNHKDGNRQNSDISNLEWLTSKENTIDGWKRGRKHSPEQLEAMRKGTIRYNHNRWHQSKECVCVL